MGFEIGLNFSSLDGFADADRVNRTVFGLFGDWRFSENFHLGGAVLPIAGRGAQGSRRRPPAIRPSTLMTAGSTMTRSVGYVEIPVLLKWAPDREEGFRVGAGLLARDRDRGTDRYESSLALRHGLRARAGHRQASCPGSTWGSRSTRRGGGLPMLSIAARYTQGLTDMRLEGTRRRGPLARPHGNRPDLSGQEAQELRMLRARARSAVYKPKRYWTPAMMCVRDLRKPTSRRAIHDLLSWYWVPTTKFHMSWGRLSSEY